MNGNQPADGTYKFVLSANLNADGTVQTVSDIRVIGKVTGVATNSDGTTALSLSPGLTVNSSNIDAAYSPTQSRRRQRPIHSDDHDRDLNP